MKIQINKSATQQRLKDEAQMVIKRAIQVAESGMDKFYHPSVRGECYNSFDLIELVSELTEDSVYKGQFYDGEIVFRIRD